MKRYDVIILGGGTSGAMAAAAAAREGAKTLVIERFSFLGGTATYGIPFLGMVTCAGEPVCRGLAAELVGRLADGGFSPGIVRGGEWNTPEHWEFSLVPFDPEGLKYVLQEMVCGAGAEVLYGAFLAGAVCEGGRVTAVELCSKSGRQRLSADVFVDCSGDADLVWQAGGRFLPKERPQNSSILMHLGNVDLAVFRGELEEGGRVKGRGTWHTRVIESPKRPGAPATLVHMAGHLQPFGAGKSLTFTAVSLRDGEVYLNASRTPGVDGADAWQVSRAEIAERRGVMELFRALRENVGGFRNAVLLGTSPLGIRESRNIAGGYVLTRDDVLGGASFPDGVARGAYPIDIHDPKGGRTQFQFIRDGGSYEIPLRCMVPAGLGGVLAAGRCISADRDALGSVRIMGCCLSQGEAAGTAAALCAARGIQPAALDGALLKKRLLG